MKLFATSSLLGFGVLAAFAGPTKRENNGPSDVELLQYSLTIEHLTAAFYREALGLFRENSFTDAGFPSFVYKRISEIYDQDADHVQSLQQELINLGQQPTQACTYSFGLTTPRAFTTAAASIENAGVSAYLSVLPLFHDSQFVTKLGAIYGVEARQTAFLSASVNKGAPWNANTETPLGLSAAYSLFAAYFKECPSTNPKLPVRDLPPVTIDNRAPIAGGLIKVSAAGNARRQSTQKTVVFLSGAKVQRAPIDRNGNAQVPADLGGQGTVYCGVSSSDSGPLDDSQLQSGLGAISVASSSSG